MGGGAHSTAYSQATGTSRASGLELRETWEAEDRSRGLKFRV